MCLVCMYLRDTVCCILWLQGKSQSLMVRCPARTTVITVMWNMIGGTNIFQKQQPLPTLLHTCWRVFRRWQYNHMMRVSFWSIWTGLPRTVDFVACAEPSLSLTKRSSEEVEEETRHQGSKVSNASPFTHKSLVPTHQDMTCASCSPTTQAFSQSAVEGSGPPREPVKGECRMNCGTQRWVESTVHPPSPQLLRLLWRVNDYALQLYSSD